jgi:hypothetical protein
MTSAAEDHQFRRARIFDRYRPGQPPVVDRPAVADDEVEPLLDYLDHAPEFLVERGFSRDVIDGAEDVPGAFFTDGTWIWSADVQHYLRKYGIPPEPDLVEHIRELGFGVPEVDDLTVARAESVVSGEPVTPPG